MPRGKKTPPETIYAIMTSWAITDNFSETARALNIPQRTVEKIVKENKDKEEFAKLCDKKRDDFADKATDIINSAMKRLKDEIENDTNKIPVNHLSTVIGTLYEKRALAKGDATENAVIEIKLPKGCEEYAQ